MNNRIMIISLNSDPVLQYGTEHNGGQSKYILELGKNLVKDNWMIDVFTVRNPGSEGYKRITEGFYVYRIGLRDEKEYSYAIDEEDINQFTNSVIQFVTENKLIYDIILCCYWLSGIAGLKLKEVLGKNTLITFCSLGYFKQTAIGESQGLSYRIEKEKYIARHVDHIIATSNEEKKVLTEYYQVLGDKISIIPRGVDTDKFRKINGL